MQISRTKKYSSFMNLWGSILLFTAAILAACVANSPLLPVYRDFLSHPVILQVGNFNLFSHRGEPLNILELINDGLMTFFFFSVGLEIKRELLVGSLSTFRKAILPIIGACGGMIFPVIVYALVCHQGSGGETGLAIPMATDIAFSLGVLSLLGKRVPLTLKVFLTTLAVADDIGGILVIAVFYSSGIELIYLLVAALVFVFVFYMGKQGVINRTFFLICGTAAWYLFLQSGVHSTIAGVILAFVVPAKPQLNVGKYMERIRRAIRSFSPMNSESTVLTDTQLRKLKRMEMASDRVISPLQSMEDDLHNVVTYLILPLFAFANAGIVLNGHEGGNAMGNVTMAVALGLLIGKFIGIFTFTMGSIKLKITPLPTGMNWKNIAGVSIIGGVGFTVSLFIANLSFGLTEPILLNQAKLGVVIGSIASGLLGYLFLRMVLPPKQS